MERMREQEATESKRLMSLKGKLIERKPQAERRHRSIVVSAEDQYVDVVCEDEQRVRGHFYKVKATNQWTGRNQQNLVCRICGKISTKLCNMKDHIRRHLSIKPFACSLCGRGFARMNTRDIHEE